MKSMPSLSEGMIKLRFILSGQLLGHRHHDYYHYSNRFPGSGCWKHRERSRR